MMIIKILIFVLLLISAVLFYGDFVIHQYQKLKRFHIGRWNNSEEWYKAVKKISLKWLKHTPYVSATDNNGNRILAFLSGKNKSNTIQSWQKAGLIIGISSCPGDEKNVVLQEWKRKELSDGNWINPFNKVDFALLAYAVLKTEYNPITSKPAMDWVIDMLENNLCKDGLISYSKGKDSNLRYVDTLGMVCPFLALYGRIYNRPEYSKLAYEQIRLFREIGVLSENQLPCHVFLSKERQALGVYGWGRGTTWYEIALLGTYFEMPEGIMKEDLKKWIFDAATQYADFQKEDGGFHSLLQNGGQYDSSVTAGMAFFYSECASIFQNSSYVTVAEKCLRKLMKVTMKTGEVDLCQGDTHGIGVFSQKYDIMPFAQGLVLKSICQLRINVK